MITWYCYCCRRTSNPAFHSEDCFIVGCGDVVTESEWQDREMDNYEENCEDGE